MDEVVERVENNFINIYKKFDILDKKLNEYHIEKKITEKVIKFLSFKLFDIF